MPALFRQHGAFDTETLSDVENKRIFFLLQVKCPVIARDSGYPVGTFLIKENGKDISAAPVE